MRVLHSAQRWGALTQSWLTNQVRNPHAEPSVLASTRDGEPSPDDPLVLLEDDAPAWARAIDRRLNRVREVSAAHAWAIRQTRPDVVHFHFGHRAWDGWRSAHLLRVPFVVTFYGNDASVRVQQNPVWQQRYQRYFRHAAAVLAEGPAMRQRLLDLGAPPDRTRVVRIGVELHDLPFTPRSRRRHEPLRVLMAGRFVQKKGFPVGVEAVGRLLQRHPGAVERLTLVGGPSDEPRSIAEAADIDRACAAWLPADVLHRPGMVPRDDLFAMAREHDILLVPSFLADDGDSEGGSPVVATELGAAGLVVVSSDHADLPALVLDDDTGLVARARDAEALSLALERIWRTSTVGPRLARSMRRHVEEHYSLARMHDRLTLAYQQAGRPG